MSESEERMDAHRACAERRDGATVDMTGVFEDMERSVDANWAALSRGGGMAVDDNFWL